jgi:hypothetical protein
VIVPPVCPNAANAKGKRRTVASLADLVIQPPP